MPRWSTGALRPSEARLKRLLHEHPILRTREVALSDPARARSTLVALDRRETASYMDRVFHAPGAADSRLVKAAQSAVPVPEPLAARRSLAIAIIGAGIVLRTLEYLARRSLWTDEAWVALNAVSSWPFNSLAAPHRFAFSLVEWIATRLGGMNEAALRSAPFAAGVILLVAFRRLAERVLDGQIVWFAVALAALSPALVYYSNEAKPYGIDALVGVVLAGSAFSVLDRTDARGGWLVLLIVAVLGLLISLPAVFVLVAIGIALVTAPEVRRHPEARWRLIVGGAIGTVVFAILYVALYRQTAADPAQRWWWQGGFLTPWSPDFFKRTGEATTDTMGEYFVGGRPEVAAVVLAALLYLAGLRQIGRRRGRSTIIVLAGPIVTAVVASAVEGYAVAPRTMLFALPLAILPLAAGVRWLVAQLPAPGRPVGLAIAGGLWFGPAFNADLDRIVRPEFPEAPRSVVEEFNRRHSDGEPVYVTFHGMTAWLFYTTEWSAPDTTRIRRMRGAPGVYDYGGRCELIGTGSGVEWRLATRDSDLQPDPGWAENEAKRIRSAARPYIWLFFSHVFAKEKAALVTAVSHIGGHAVFAFETEGAALYRYRFDSAVSGDSPGTRFRSDRASSPNRATNCTE